MIVRLRDVTVESNFILLHEIESLYVISFK